MSEAAAVRTMSSTSIGPQVVEEHPPITTGFEVDHHLHEAVGNLAGNYPCTFEGTRGTLFVGSGGVSFVGWVFFFQKRVDILWNDVLQVIKSTTSGSHGISFVMRDTHVEYSFEEIQHAERVWPVLINLHNEALHNPTKEPMVTPLRASLRRMSTDPIYPTAAAHETTTTTTSPSTSSPSGQEAAYVAAAAVASNEELRTSVSSRNMAAESVAKRHSMLLSSPARLQGDEKEIGANLQQAWNELQGSVMDAKSNATSAIQVRDLSFCFYSLILLFSHYIIIQYAQDKVLACNLTEFFDTFFADDAPCPYSTFMESSGDTILNGTPWKKDENDVFVRTIEYTHPVNAPLAPPEARARKEQRYRRYGTAGLSIETDTYVEDVPMADCFYVTDKLLVEPNEDEAVVLLAEFDIVFIKQTMFRSLIANTTKSEFLKMFQGLQVYWTEALEGPVVKVTEEEEQEDRRRSSTRRASSIRRTSMFGSAVETVPVEQYDDGTTTPVVVTSTGFAGSWLLILLLVLVLLMQSWLMMEMIGMKTAMDEMQVKMASAGETCPTLETVE